MKSILLSATTVLLMASAAFAQQKDAAFTMPSASPKTTVVQQFSTSNIKIEYSRPSVKGRTIFGDVVPFGKPWRTGANMITKVTFEEDVFIEGQKLAAGAYALYTIPNKDSWTVIFNTAADSPGLNKIEAANDVLKVEAKVTALEQLHETLTIEVAEMNGNNAAITIQWEKTKVSIPLKVDNKDRIMEYLSIALQGENPPYREAAFFYYEHDYKLEEVVKYADIVLKQRPEAFWMLSLKANTLKKLGKKQEAIEAAQKAADMTKGTNFEAEYQSKLNAIKA